MGRATAVKARISESNPSPEKNQVIKKRERNEVVEGRERQRPRLEMANAFEEPTDWDAFLGAWLPEIKSQRKVKESLYDVAEMFSPPRATARARAACLCCTRPTRWATSAPKAARR